jgi:FKBP-type peptidyl-prolyl cis-trans isomerase FkpA
MESPTPSTFLRARFLVTVGAALTFSACASGGGGGGGDPTEVEFSPELGIFLDQMTLTPQGLYYHDLSQGSGDEARVNDRVTIHYRGWHPDGRLFDSSLSSGEPMEFVLGHREVIRGWELGIQGMRVGGRRLLVIPPRLGYGGRGVPGVIPGNATLVFEVQLVAIGG